MIMTCSSNDAATNSTCSIASLCLDYKNNSTLISSLLMLSSGICWTSAYIIYILVCYKYKTYVGVPVAALFLNLAWEFVFSFVWTANMGAPQLVVNRVWLGFDVVLLYMFLKYEYQKRVGWYMLLGITMGMLLVCLIVELHDYDGIYMAFGQNLLMSVLFVNELQLTTTTMMDADLLKKLLLGGILRGIGTACASLVFYMRTTNSMLLLFLYCAIFVWDVAYVWTATVMMIWRDRQQSDSNQLSASLLSEEADEQSNVVEDVAEASRDPVVESS